MLHNFPTWIHFAGTDQCSIFFDNPFLEVDVKTMIYTFIIPTTAWMGMMVTNQLLVYTESSRRTVKKVRTLTSNTVISSIGVSLAGASTVM